MSQPQATATDTVNAMNANLVKAFVEREDAQAAIKRCDETILAIRNVLAGVQVGSKLQTEILAEQAAKVPAKPATIGELMPDTIAPGKVAVTPENVTVLHRN